jgi:hypothetical protein
MLLATAHLYSPLISVNSPFAHVSSATCTTQIGQSIVANLNATHDEAPGNAITIDAAQDTIAIQNVVIAQQFAHHSDFHL